MAHIQERREELLLAAEQLEKEQFAKSIRKLEETYRKKELRDKIKEAFSGLAVQWRKDFGEEKKAACLGVCFLYSSIVRRDYKLKLILMDEELWLEEDGAEAVWKPEGFFEPFETDMEAVIEGLQKRFIRLCKAEEDAVRLWCVEYYFAALRCLCADMAEEIMTCKEMEELNRTEGFYLFFGHDQGEGEILWREKKEQTEDV